MIRRHPLPRCWLMTDERSGEALWDALDRLPRGSGVVFRHYQTHERERRLIFRQVQRIARRRRLVLVLADTSRRAADWRADGIHGPRKRQSTRPMLHTAAAHDGRELIRAVREKVDLIFLSPIFATRSHPGGHTLGPVRFGLLARSAPKARLIALGGLTLARFRRLRKLGAFGWAAIDAWAA